MTLISSSAVDLLTQNLSKLMKTLLLLTLSLAIFSCTTTPAFGRPPKKMKAFASERELQRYLHKVAQKQRRAVRKMGMTAGGAGGLAETVSVSASPSYDQSITNTQTAGVDEGGIVKLHGDHLVVLRRGRLFTIAIGDSALTPISTINAFGPDIDPDGSWYDEMLVSGDTIVVIGYSYDRGGTEVGLFDINAQGQLSYRSTYHLRTNDYYSSRNYASRLIGSKLIFYSPLQFYAGYEDPVQALPALRKWHKGATIGDFRRIITPSRLYLPQANFDVEDGITLHSVTICELANRRFDCHATSVIGPPGHVFYVSKDSVYIWAASWSVSGDPALSLLFRMPLDGSAPGALRVSGGPVDQFSFLESDDNFLNVLVRSESKGDGMWAAEVAEGDVAMMRIPLTSFSDGSQIAPATSYRQLPKPEGRYFQNRFVGNYLIYGTGSGWGNPEIASQQNDLFIVELERGDLHKLSLLHGVDRIEQMGDGAIVIGTDEKNLHFSSLRLNQQPEIASHFAREDASQGETRSHGFFYKPDGEGSGIIGLPMSLPARPAYKQLFESSAAIVFLRNEALKITMLGELGAQPEKALDDQCRASCVDWYGNARPLFVRGRVFALLGYELVEGKFDNGRMIETRRINYGPTISQP